MVQPTRIRKHSTAGTDWARLIVGVGLALTWAMQLTTMRSSDLESVYGVLATISRFAALTGAYCAIVGIFLVARIPWVERGVGHIRLVRWHQNLGPWSLYLIGAIAAAFMHQVLNGQMFVGHTLNRIYWTGLYVAMAVPIIYWRIGVPLA